MTEQELMKLKEKIDSAKTNIAELKGRKKLLEEQMQKEWKCKNIKELANLLKKKQEEVTVLDKEIDNLSEKIKDNYNVT